MGMRQASGEWFLTGHFGLSKAGDVKLMQPIT